MKKCHLPPSGGAWSTWDGEGVNIGRAEVYCPHGGRVGQRVVSIHRNDVSSLQGMRVGREWCHPPQN